MKKVTDLSGQVFERLTVLERDYEKQEKMKTNKTYWKCLCECGNITTVQGYDLKSGNTKSCGCLKKELAIESKSVNITNKKFGKLTALYKIDAKLSSWHCRCDCGNEVDVLTTNLLNKMSKSCGCVNSHGERGIQILLNKHNIKFKKSYSFDNLISPKNKKHTFDFGILNENNELQYLIEFDGRQHFYYTNEDWNTEENFNKLREYDLAKDKYCFDNNIPLIRIPYICVNKVTLEDLILESSQYILTPENEKEYYEKYKK